MAFKVLRGVEVGGEKEGGEGAAEMTTSST
jgi:hypothetical protein